MELTRDYCKGEDCGKLTVIVNKRYCLCDECNFKRLHDGKSKQEVYSSRQKGRDSVNIQKKITDKRELPVLDNIKGVKKASQLKQISSTDKFLCSDGTRVSQVTIKRKYAEVCDKIKQERPPMCQGSGRWDVPLSFSHTISQADCKALGKTELIWDADNIEIEGFEAPTSNPEMAHNIWEVAAIDKKIMLLNFERKLEYIKKHDAEGYQKLIVQLDELERKVTL